MDSMLLVEILVIHCHVGTLLALATLRDIHD